VHDASGEQEIEDLHDGNLDGVGILQHRQFKGWEDAYARGYLVDCVGDGEALLLPSIMEEAEPFVAEGGRSALGAISLDVLAAVNVGVIGHGYFFLFVDILES